MACVPFTYDQPYHAARMAELNGTPVIPAARFERTALCHALQVLVERRADCTLDARSLADDLDGADAAGRAVLAQLEHATRPELNQ
jgi:hypothetical protein